ncbi:hypothetical protein Y032_0153g2936 [Ancylostoma ceylanicum]|uniref:Uncharacterized protein n=1 Tax=Ancylostoma ceylanicum TaxID=53326 RepID=A0A016T0D0_9BILA|nr:hypothetical protein Y032_0153g2936 [Ancylostoma ceylanicum]
MGILVVYCINAAGHLCRDAEENRYVVISRCLRRCSEQSECQRRGPSSCLRPFGVHTASGTLSAITAAAWYWPVDQLVQYNSYFFPCKF